MSCPSDNTFADFLDGRLTGAELIMFYEHASGCAACAATLAGLSRQKVTIRPVDSEAEPVIPPSSSNPVPAWLRQPQAVGRYQPVEVLGAGGMGIVYLARDTQLNRRVALKVTSHDVSRASVLRLLREAQVMARLSHRNVVAVHDVGLWQQHVFVAMEYVEGGTLARYLLEGERSWPEILDKFVQAGQGLAAAHFAGIAHRDFKAENVLLTASGEARVADFGLACALAGDDETPSSTSEKIESRPDVQDALRARLTRVGTVMGTLAYMAPEQLRGSATDHRADIWSFCAALYEALYCELPFPGRTPNEVLRHIELNSIRRPPANSQVPRWLRRVLITGLNPDPEKRIPSMDALLTALERKRYKRQPRWRMRAGIALGASTAVAGGLLLLRLRALPVAPDVSPSSGSDSVTSKVEPTSEPSGAAPGELSALPSSASSGPPPVRERPGDDPERSAETPPRPVYADRVSAGTRGRQGLQAAPSTAGVARSADGVSDAHVDSGEPTGPNAVLSRSFPELLPPALPGGSSGQSSGSTAASDGSAPIIRD